MLQRIGFVTRHFPPAIGGLERAADGWHRMMKGIFVEVHLLAHGGSVKLLPIFLLRAPFYLLLWRLHGVRHLHLHDASMVILLWPFWKMFPITTCTVNGLDITYRQPLYQWLFRRMRSGIACFYPISHNTGEACRASGIPQERICVIPDGFFPSEDTIPDVEAAWMKCKERHPTLERGALNVIWVGRVIQRKGILWFIEQVMPLLNGRDVRLWVVGGGPQIEECRQLVRQFGLLVHFLGRISDEELHDLRACADLSIMPNIPVPNDIEGFGLVNLEANEVGLWVLAANLDGIPEVVHDQCNGSLLAAGNPQIWKEAIELWQTLTPSERRDKGLSAREYSRATFSWHEIGRRCWIPAFEQLYRKNGTGE